MGTFNQPSAKTRPTPPYVGLAGRPTMLANWGLLAPREASRKPAAALKAGRLDDQLFSPRFTRNGQISVHGSRIGLLPERGFRAQYRSQIGVSLPPIW